MIVETKWGRFDGEYLLTPSGAAINCHYALSNDGEVLMAFLFELKDYLLKHSAELGEISNISFVPNGRDVQVRVDYSSGASRSGGAQELWFKAILDCYAQNKVKFDADPIYVKVASVYFGVTGDKEFAIEPYVAALLKL